MSSWKSVATNPCTRAHEGLPKNPKNSPTRDNEDQAEKAGRKKMQAEDDSDLDQDWNDRSVKLSYSTGPNRPMPLLI